MSESRDGRRARGQASRHAILTAAIGLTAEGGVSTLTHRAVAARAQVSHALVTYHFATADELRRATLAHACARLGDRLEELLGERPDPGDVPTVAAELVVKMVTIQREDTLTCYELMLAAGRDPNLRPVMEDLTRRLGDLLEPLAGSADLALRASSALLGQVLVAIALGQDDDVEMLRRAVTEMVEHFDPARTPPA